MNNMIMMLCEEDIKWLLENLPIELVRHIIASYNPNCFFMMDGLLDHDWTQQCRLTFGYPHKSSIYTYYNLCQNQRIIRLSACKNNSVACRADGISYFGISSYSSFVDKSFCGDIVNITPYDPMVVMTSDRKLFGRGCNMYRQLGPDDKYTHFTEISNIPDDIVQIGCGYDYIAILRSNGIVMINGRDFNFESDYKFRKMNAPPDIVQISCSNHSMFIVRANGVLMAIGWNKHGELGIWKNGYHECFVEINGVPKDIIQIACSGDHTILMRADGTLLSSGHNGYGQLGHGDMCSRSVFTEIKGLPRDIKQIVCSRCHSFIIRENGSLMSCGDNNYGQLGLGDYINRHTFTQVQNIDNVSQIACGDKHTIIMKTDESLMGCGNNKQYQLGLNMEYTNKFEKITV